MGYNRKNEASRRLATRRKALDCEASDLGVSILNLDIFRAILRIVVQIWAFLELF